MILVFLAVIAAIGALAWQCARDVTINFLPSDRRAEWIVFPMRVDAISRSVAMLDAVFRREFVLTDVPQNAQLSVRGAKRVELKINGASVVMRSGRNWKEIVTADVAPFLRVGQNRIEARVFNDNAPPSLWLVLNTDQETLRSDQTWSVSFAGSAWRDAVLASRARFPGPGNPISGGETMRVLLSVWPIELLFGAIALLACGAAWRWRARFQFSAAGFSAKQIVAVLGIITIFWMLLFWHNATLLPFFVGFDSGDHVNYINYIQERRSLPSPTEGYEMFQPPLYYALSAMVLSIGHLGVHDDFAIVVLRSLTTLFCIANFVLVFLTMRLLFPAKIKSQLVGLTLAAFLPMQLYLSHYVTNETLAATLVTASFYLAVRILKATSPALSDYLCLGLCVGAALLTKTTAALLVPILLLALIAKLWLQPVPTGIRLRNLGLMLLLCLAVSGWHYLKIWRRFGTPFLGNWDLAAGFPWWQHPGYHVAADYIRFGRSLTAPLFSGLNGFADGIYSTLWGDGLCGGASDIFYRPPWNYDLMVTGYFLAIVPTLLIFTGAGVSLWRFVREPRVEWFLLLGAAAATLFGIVFMTLRVASYAQVKAFYGLVAVVPMCGFAVIGWEVWTKRRRLLQYALGGALLLWAMNSFAGVWIQHSSDQRVFAALRLRDDHKIDAALDEAHQAVALEPSNPAARRVLAALLEDLGRPDEAMAEAEKAIELSPMDGLCHLELAMILVKQNQMERAMSEGQRAVELGPENPSPYNLLLLCLLQSNRRDEVSMVSADALTVSPFNAQLHYTLGVAAAQHEDFAVATSQFGYALLLRPKWAEPYANLRLALSSLKGDSQGFRHLQEAAAIAPESPILLNEFAWLLATNPDAALRNDQDALQLAQRACATTEGKNPTLLATLAAAYAQSGRFSEAISTAEKALSLAHSAADESAVKRNENLLACFRANHPYREEPTYK